MAQTQHMRLLLGSKLTRHLKRAHHDDIDLTRLLNDERFARAVVMANRSLEDAVLATLMDEFERLSLECGAWNPKTTDESGVYQPNSDGMVSAAAAWDPNYNPPARTVPPEEPEIVREATVSPRVNTAVTGRPNSSFLSRLGLSRPPDSSSTHSRTQSDVSSTSPDEPVDPNKKKYMRGAR